MFGSNDFSSPMALSSEITMVYVLDPPLKLDTTDAVGLCLPSFLRSLLFDQDLEALLLVFIPSSLKKGLFGVSKIFV